MSDLFGCMWKNMIPESSLGINKPSRPCEPHKSFIFCYLYIIKPELNGYSVHAVCFVREYDRVLLRCVGNTSPCAASHNVAPALLLFLKME